MANLLDNPKSCKELGVPENMAAHLRRLVTSLFPQFLDDFNSLVAALQEVVQRLPNQRDRGPSQEPAAGSRPRGYHSAPEKALEAALVSRAVRRRVPCTSTTWWTSDDST